mgnify:CR=1 FL=1
MSDTLLILRRTNLIITAYREKPYRVHLDYVTLRHLQAGSATYHHVCNETYTKELPDGSKRRT